MDSAKDGLIKWLQGQEWTYFFTLTTRYELTVKSARRLASRWFDEVALKGSRIFWVCEKNECRDGSHLHGLLFVPDYSELFKDEKIFNPFKNCIMAWQKVSRSNKKDQESFNRCQFKRYDKKRGAVGYCAAYITKKDADYDYIIG